MVDWTREGSERREIEEGWRVEARESKDREEGRRMDKFLLEVQGKKERKSYT